MNSLQFFKEVRRMRELQCEYFRFKDKDILHMSMLQEQKVDKEIERVVALKGEDYFKD